MADPVPTEIKVNAAWSALSFVYGLAGSAIVFLLGINKLRKIVPITKEDFLEHVNAVNARFQSIENKFEGKLLQLHEEAKASNGQILTALQGLKEDRAVLKALTEVREIRLDRIEKRLDDFLTKVMGA